MNKEELVNVPELKAEDKVIIWKMNYGFKSDLQGEINQMSMQQEENSVQPKGKATMDIKKLKLYTLVYGIFEAPILGIKPPKDLGLGLTEEEKNQRIRAIRALEPKTGDFLFTKTHNYNKEDNEKTEQLKKN